MTKFEKILLIITAAFFAAACFLIPGCSSVVAQSVPVPSEPSSPSPSAAPVSSGDELWLSWEVKVDLNHATAEELTVLPGIGPVTAEKIIAYREANGLFSSPEELLAVDGIGQSTLDAIYALAAGN